VKGVTVSPFFGQEQYEGVGSGIVYTSDGYILTNDHVVSQNGREADSVQVTLATGEVLDATIVARDASKDLALLKIDKTGLTPVVFAQSSDVKVGQWAIAIGSPLDYRNSVTEGIVSGLHRDLETGDPTSPQLTGLLQTDAAISPGNSGGGLFNAAGELIGMPEAYISAASGAENMGFAIPADTVAAVATQLMGR
jgi:S1-C subfamily serine protease